MFKDIIITLIEHGIITVIYTFPTLNVSLQVEKLLLSQHNNLKLYARTFYRLEDVIIITRDNANSDSNYPFSKPTK